jgi:hypothetical protein
MVDVKVGTTADEARRRSAEAVLRIREESRLRVARRRHRSCFSWCMVASLVGGISLAAMDAYEARLQRVEAEEAARQASEGKIQLQLTPPGQVIWIDVPEGVVIDMTRPDEREWIRTHSP